MVAAPQASLPIRVLAVAALATFICVAPSAAQSTPQEGPKPQQAPLPPLGHPAGVFGAGVNLERATPLADVVADPMKVHGRPVRVDGVMADVCTRKGCWMVMRDGDVEMRVRFKDYAFFVPRDSHERRVIAQGIITVEEQTEEAAKHYAEESGHPERAAEIVGPQKVVTMVATGVEVFARDEAPLAAQGTPEALAALEKKLAAATKLGQVGKPADVAAAYASLKAVPGARTEELSAAVEAGGWIAFAAEGGAPFARGVAVKKDTGDVVRFQ